MECKLPGAKCTLCSLYSEPVVPAVPVENPKIIFVGEAPGAVEVAEGAPFVGPSGQLLRSTIEALGSDPNQMFYTNAVACRPPNNREPYPGEVECCRGRLAEELFRYPEADIVSLGRVAQEALDVGLEDSGMWVDTDFGPVLSTFHPAYVLRKVEEASKFLRDIRTSIRGAQVRDNQIDTQVRNIATLDDLKTALSEMPEKAWTSVDIETDQVNWYSSNGEAKNFILSMQIAWNTDYALVLNDEMLYDTPGTADVLMTALANQRIVGHNFKFDAVFLASHLNLRLNATFDTYLAHYLIDENLPHGLKELVRTEFSAPDYEKELIAQYLRTKNDRYSKIPFDKLSKYGALDAGNTLLLRERFQRQLETEDMLEWPMNNIIMPASNMFTDVELRGIMVDRNVIENVHTEFQKDMDEKAAALREMCGNNELNVDAPAQLAEVIYDHYGFPEQIHWKIKPRSTAHDAIEKFKGAPFIDLLLDYRRVAKMQRAYAKNIWKFMETDTDRVHGDVRIPGTEVGRISVADPALQTIPRPSEYYGALIRSLFIPRPGYLFVDADYSQAELRVLGALSMEDFLIRVYLEDRDLHTEVALAMYGPGFTKEQRMNCKMFNFSYAYGGTEKSFAEDAGLNIGIARQFVNKYNQNMPKALAWKQAQFETMLDKGEVRTIFGRKRRFPLITEANKSEARKASVHMPVASTSNDLTLISALRLDKDGVPIVLTIHDSIIAEVPEAQARDTAVLMKETMESVGREFLPQITWKADAKIRTRWAEPLPREQV